MKIINISLILWINLINKGDAEEALKCSLWNREVLGTRGFCVNTCDNPDAEKDCTAIGETTGCVCQEGYIREKDGGDCIIASQCKNRQCGNRLKESFVTCGANTCGMTTCEDLAGPLRLCTIFGCVAGCKCDDGYTRTSSTNEQCIPTTSCAKVVCKANEKFVNCNDFNDGKIKKEQICKTETLVVPKSDFCVKSSYGCMCQDGFSRDLRTGLCVKTSECGDNPKCTSPNTEFSKCGNDCGKASCFDLVDHIKMCRMMCMPGCHCKEGFTYNNLKEKRCIPINTCNKEVCKEGEEMINCNDLKEGKSQKEGICYMADYWKVKDKGSIYNLSLCNKSYYSCQCSNGFLRDMKTGKCKPVDECDRKCPIGKVWSKCDSHCPKTCLEPNGTKLCTKNCVPGCVCAEGTVEHWSGKCIKPDQCEKCGENQNFNKCHSSCFTSCSQPNGPEQCIEKCRTGCDCNKGFVWGPDKKCIKLNECKEEPKCGLNQSYSTCHSSCIRTCNEPNGPEKCIKKCWTGCDCNEGFVWGPGKKCIKVNECKEEPKCGDNQEYSECHSPLTCLKTCYQPNGPEVCTEECRVGCDCKKGFVWNKDRKCIPLNECEIEPKCGDNQEYSKCHSTCLKTCYEPNGPKECNKKCRLGCDCKKGFVWSSDKKCVPVNECKIEPKCGDNQEYSKCHSTCFKTCNQPNGPETCTEECRVGCDCKKGFVWSSDRKCVKVNDCKLRKTCSYNEEWSDTNGHCSATCTDVNEKGEIEPFTCTKQVVAGCKCKEGFVRHGKSCMKATECKNITCQDKPNQEFSACFAFTCSDKCKRFDGPYPLCDQPDWCVSGCKCKEGYYKNIKDECVSEDECKTEICGENEIWKSCRDLKTFGNIQFENPCFDKKSKIDQMIRPLPHCISNAIGACVCANGYGRDAKGQCKESKKQCLIKKCKFKADKQEKKAEKNCNTASGIIPFVQNSKKSKFCIRNLEDMRGIVGSIDKKSKFGFTELNCKLLSEQFKEKKCTSSTKCKARKGTCSLCLAVKKGDSVKLYNLKKAPYFKKRGKKVTCKGADNKSFKNVKTECECRKNVINDMGLMDADNKDALSKVISAMQGDC